MLKLIDFDYNLPKELIAQFPSEKRDFSRFLVLHRDTGRIEHRIFRDIVEYLKSGDVLVLNDTKVIPARLIGRKETGGKVEVLVLNPSIRCQVSGVKFEEEKICEVLVKPRKGIRIGGRIDFADRRLSADVKMVGDGRVFLKFDRDGNFNEVLDKFGKVPLPPYIKREPEDMDKRRYQTVYAKKEGAIAAPTAGLHFTKRLLERLEEKGVCIEYVTLHVGYGTFKPIRCEDVSLHKMEKEYFAFVETTKERLKRVKKEGGRIFAVGTTTCRVLETIAGAMPRTVCSRSRLGQYRGWTNLFIHPPYKFKFVDALITNFHLPKTTLLLLVSAFCGRKLLFKAYRKAIEKRYRFYSYGDAMLIL